MHSGHSSMTLFLGGLEFCILGRSRRKRNLSGSTACHVLPCF